MLSLLLLFVSFLTSSCRSVSVPGHNAESPSTALALISKAERKERKLLKRTDPFPGIPLHSEEDFLRNQKLPTRTHPLQTSPTKPAAPPPPASTAPAQQQQGEGEGATTGETANKSDGSQQDDKSVAEEHAVRGTARPSVDTTQLPSTDTPMALVVDQQKGDGESVSGGGSEVVVSEKTIGDVSADVVGTTSTSSASPKEEGGDNNEKQGEEIRPKKEERRLEMPGPTGGQDNDEEAGADLVDLLAGKKKGEEEKRYADVGSSKTHLREIQYE